MTWWCRPEAGDRSRRLQRVLGHARNLPLHARLRLRSANTHGLPSFPARVPRIELDFILVSAGIEVTDFRVPDVRYSDHRPLRV